MFRDIYGRFDGFKGRYLDFNRLINAPKCLMMIYFEITMRLGHIFDNKTPSELTPIIEMWLMDLHIKKHSVHTISAYQAALHQFAKFLHTQSKDWRECQQKQLEIYFSQRLDVDALNIASIKLELSAIRQFYRFAIQQGLTDQNPTTGYRLKGKPRPLPTITTEEMMAQLLEQNPPDDSKKAQLWIRDKAMFELMYSSGLRLSELVGLDVHDVNINEGLVHVLGKGNKERLIPVGKKAIEALLVYLPQRALWQNQTNALFISEKYGTRLTQRAVQLRLKICAKNAGIDQNLYPHLLRHCFASHLLSASGELRAIQEMLGHSSINTTQIYTQVDFGSLTKVYDKAHPRATSKHKKTKAHQTLTTLTADCKTDKR